MLIKELLSESYAEDKASNDLMDLLLLSSQKKVNKIPIKGVIKYLRNLNNNVDKKTITSLLSLPNFDQVIERSDDKYIMLKSDEVEGTVAPDEMEQSQAKVDSTAAKVADKAVKSGDNL